MAKKVVTFGEIMIRLSTENFARFTQASKFDVVYGGSEANVAVSLSCFGMPTAHVTKFPDNDLGEAAVQALRKYQVGVEHIKFGAGRLGIYFLENGSMQRPSRIIYDRYHSAFAEIGPDEFDWAAILKDAAWFHYTGITPAISQHAADSCLQALRKAKQLGIPVSGDINYRRVLWQYGKTAKDVMPELVKHTDLVIGGVTDFENCLGISGNDYEDACKNVMAAYAGVKRIASTFRETVSSSHNTLYGVLWNGKEMLRSKEYELTHIVDRVGGGDAFMAGLLWGLLNKKDDHYAIEFGTAASVLKHSIEGDVNLASLAEVETLMEGKNIGKLLR